jgi:hypothetical protein
MRTSSKHALLALALFYSSFAIGQQLPEGVLVDWSVAGRQGVLPVYDTIQAETFGFIGDGQTPNDLQMADLLATNTTSPTVFFFPPGDYFFEKPIQLHAGQVIKGASATETRFIFDLAEAAHLITAQGTATADSAQVLFSIPKDSANLTLDNPALFQEGDFIKIIAEDDDLITSSWAAYSTGQICRITSVEGDKLTVEPALRRSFSLQDNPRIVRIEPLQLAGLECLSIVRKDSTSQQTSNIFFNLVANCWVSGVNSENCNFSHVTVQQSTQVSVSESYFHDAFDYGGGGKGYGVVLQFGAGSCLVENNIFWHLRHSMLLQAGANGNVCSYNYSTLPFWTGTNLPPNAAGDLVLHGNYVYANLLEGNIVHNIVIDNSHGINGPGNTFFRNRAELFGIFMNSNPASSGQLFIGNEITSAMPFTGLYILAGTGHFEYGNNIRQSITPAGTTELTLASLYLSGQPDYFQENSMELASIGLPNAINSGSIPARQRFLEGQMTACEPMDSVVVVVDTTTTATATTQRLATDWHIYPNPTTGSVYLPDGTSGGKIIVRNLSGREVFRTRLNGQTQVNLSGLPPAMYFVVVENGGALHYGKIVLTRG